MAEFVQLRKEKWTEALSALEQLGLLEQVEFRTVVENIDKFEHKLQAPSRKLEDVIAYVQFECLLLRRIQRTRKLRDQYDQTVEIDRFIYNEIRSQFGSAELSFKHDVDFWNARLKFVGTMVPEEDRESEFNLTFKKALNYCGKSNFNLSKFITEQLWFFLKVPNVVVKKKRKIQQRKNCARLMTTVREVVMEALRNFPNLIEVSIWAIVNELKYLCVLKEEQAILDDDPKTYIAFDVSDEREKTAGVIKVFYNDFMKKVQHTKSFEPYFMMHDEINKYDVPEANSLAKTILSEILSIKPKPPEVYGWLIGKSLGKRNISECIERINQALSTIPKSSMLDICLDKLDAFVEDSLLRYRYNHFSEILQFYADLFGGDSSWEKVSSAKFHISRIEFVKKIPIFIEVLANDNHAPLIATLQSLSEKYSLNKLVKLSVERFPKNFYLVRERILQLVSKADFKSGVMRKYLSEVDWKSAGSESEVLGFLRCVYYAFMSSDKNDGHIGLVLKLKIIPGMDDICALHLRTLYVQDIFKGREFYKEYRFLVSGWKLACAAVQIETTICSSSGEYSEVLKLAIEDSLRICGATSIEPWVDALRCHSRMSNRKETSQLLGRAAAKFSTDEKDNRKYEQLLLISRKLKLGA